jgi:hypothetical protein
MVRWPETIGRNMNNDTDYIGFEVHKKTISYCIKGLDGAVREEGVIMGRAITRRFAK